MAVIISSSDTAPFSFVIICCTAVATLNMSREDKLVLGAWTDWPFQYQNQSYFAIDSQPGSSSWLWALQGLMTRFWLQSRQLRFCLSCGVLPDERTDLSCNRSQSLYVLARLILNRRQCQSYFATDGQTVSHSVLALTLVMVKTVAVLFVVGRPPYPEDGSVV